mmetsp:Transcript_72/g.204  ORF Transcript_72/g.204 Transcript_72/m.204 type:complete len:159 (+) Transcript_72:3-479(+)
MRSSNFPKSARFILWCAASLSGFNTIKNVSAHLVVSPLQPTRSPEQHAPIHRNVAFHYPSICRDRHRRAPLPPTEFFGRQQTNIKLFPLAEIDGGTAFLSLSESERQPFSASGTLRPSVSSSKYVLGTVEEEDLPSLAQFTVDVFGKKNMRILYPTNK